MKYYYDFEFLEGSQDKRFLGIKYGETKPTIDVISVGIVSEDNKEYYAISKEFNLKEAWNKFQLEQQSGDMRNIFPEGKKVYWIRDNVLKPILEELLDKEYNETSQYGDHKPIYNLELYSYKKFKRLVNKYGKTNKQIANEIKSFVTPDWYWSDGLGELPSNRLADNPIQLYGYYSDYDHVALCQLFGTMNQLPDGFPMYTIDLKQTLDENFKGLNEHQIADIKDGKVLTESGKFYPKQTDEHNALSDAKFNKELYEFLNNL